MKQSLPASLTEYAVSYFSFYKYPVFDLFLSRLRRRPSCDRRPPGKLTILTQF